VGDLDFGPDAAFDLPKLLVSWYDHWMKGMANGAEAPPVRIFVMGDNTWRNETAWPLPDAKYTDYYFGGSGKANTAAGDGSLGTTPPAKGQAQDTFVYDPAVPVPTVGGVSGGATGPRAQASLADRKDILSYTSAPLTERVEVTGPIKVTLFAATNAADTDFTAKLVDVAPDGSAHNIQDGIIRARYRTSLEKAEPIKPGAVLEYTIDLWATSNAFLPGHKIRVDISSSNFPRFDRNPNTGGRIADEREFEVAEQRVHHDPEHPSRITLPVVPAAR
jgi:putative CocE/NonD family hydrolase